MTATDGGPDAIERALARANEQALPTMAANFVHPEWRMSAAEFRRFWGSTRLAPMSTVGPSPCRPSALSINE